MTASPAKPTLDGVLAATAPGRMIRLRLTDQQRRALRDRDGQLALRILRALVAARRSSVAPGSAPVEFPMVPHAMQAVAARLGIGHLGEKRCYQMRARLLVAAVIVDAGFYRPAYTRRGGDGSHRVPLPPRPRPAQNRAATLRFRPYSCAARWPE